MKQDSSPAGPADREQLEKRKADAARRRKKRLRQQRINRICLIVVIVLAVVLALVAGAFFYVRHLRKGVSTMFAAAPAAAATAVPAASAVPGTQAPDLPSEPEDSGNQPESTEQPSEPGQSLLTAGGTSDYQLSDNIVNILLIGVDYAEERLTEEWLDEGGSSAEHADVMIVLAINFDKQTVDMISLPRDTYAKIPGVRGIYKLNASLDCGGGLYEKDENGKPVTDEKGSFIVNRKGFEKVCESCSRMIAGLPVNYYYAVTMPAVKQLVDAIGGVDYNVDVAFEMNGREYAAGPQHMNGQGVLDYLRVRKAASMKGASQDDVGDGARVNRQKEMLVAILNQLRSNGLLLKVPEILKSFDGQMFTNCSFDQTAALAMYAYDMPTGNIKMWSMDGTWTSKRVARLNFCFTDQEKRVSIIKQVYGIDVPQDRECTMAYAYYFWNDLVAERYLSTSHPLYKKSASGSELRKAYSKVSNLRRACAESAERYLAGESDYLFGAAENLERANANLKAAAESAQHHLGSSGRLDFYSTLERYNEIQVDPS
ncbi:MAG: LCP family protein [Clostridia bacterium]|nr:LCP family protein [Clostridia bacterium]MBR0444855.1 LCP family protein [Clostridia bacterium]